MILDGFVTSPERLDDRSIRYWCRQHDLIDKDVLESEGCYAIVQFDNVKYHLLSGFPDNVLQLYLLDIDTYKLIVTFISGQPIDLIDKNITITIDEEDLLKYFNNSVFRLPLI